MKLKQKKRGEIPDKFKWHLHNICVNVDVWHERIAAIKDKIEGIIKYQGKLGTATVLLDGLNEVNQISEEFVRLFVYAKMKHHEDTAITENQAIADIADSVLSSFKTVISFIKPEVLALGKEAVLSFFAEIPGLELYRHYLDDLLRQKDHVLNAEAEAILAEFEEIGNAPQNIFSMLQNADIKFGFITDEDGKEVEVTQGRYRTLIQSTDRRVRMDAFNAYYDSWWKQKNTLAASYNASVKKDVLFARTRKYSSSLDMALSEDNIPRAVYDGLVSTIHSYLPSLHRYMALRKKVLGLDELHVYDRSVPIVAKVDVTISYQEAKEKLMKGLTPLGQDYLEIMQKGMENGWVDVYENEGKRTGAYSWGAYGTPHPYVLMNYEDKGMDSMFTLAHEMGHAMHSYLTWNNQPNVYGNYSMFLAEVASTVNETLLMEYLLNTNDDTKMRAYLINEYIDQFLGTVFYQVLLAEFEGETHAMVERSEPLTLENMNILYRSLNAKYYGPELVLDEKIDLAWARIPHFYRTFYVYQYATGYSAAVAFTKRILGNGLPDAEARDAYLGFLKSGSSDYSTNILQKAGVDMTVSTSIREALDVFAKLVIELEDLLVA